MKNSNRREFLQTSAVLLAASIAGSSFDFKKTKPALSFSSLGCPDWNFVQIIKFAVENQYTGIELRGILRELDLTKCKEFNSSGSRAATVKLMKDNGLKFVGLGSSATMHFDDLLLRKKNLDEGRVLLIWRRRLVAQTSAYFPTFYRKIKIRMQQWN